MTKVLFLCTGNTCRSPMAEAIFNAKAKTAGVYPEVSAASAGLYAFDGDSAYPPAVKVLGWRDMDLSGHKSRRATSAIIEDADLVLTMTRDHAETARAWFPQSARKIFVFGEFAKILARVDEDDDPARLIEAVSGRVEWERPSTEHDIPDPFGHSEEMYDRLADTIEGFVDRLISKLALREKGSA